MNAHSSTPPRFHLWTAVATLLAAMSMFLSNTLGNVDEYQPSPNAATVSSAPDRARRFGWPAVFEWRPLKWTLVPLSDVPQTSWDFISTLGAHGRWIFSKSGYLEFHPIWFAFNVAFALMLVASTAYVVEYFCRSHPNTTRIKITTLLAVTGWTATLLLVEKSESERMTGFWFMVHWIISLRVIFLAFFWFAAVDLTRRGIEEWFHRSDEQRAKSNGNRST